MPRAFEPAIPIGGNQTAMLISKSEVGFETSKTWQNDGTPW
jgi:hypothetical protein